MKPVNNKKRLWQLTPLIGTLFFIVLYILATLAYPGGSQVDKNSVGFSWANNYWCNLLNEHSMNGQHNPARPIALWGTLILCLTLGFFWYRFPIDINLARRAKRTIQATGVLAMFTVMFLFTGFHDAFLNVASFLGVIAVIGTLTALFSTKKYNLFLFGILNLLLVAANNYVYYTDGLIIYLPVVQKISFASFLLWICCINIHLYRYPQPKLIREDKNC